MRINGFGVSTAATDADDQPGLAEPGALPEIAQVIPVGDADQTLGARILDRTIDGFITSRDLRLASDIADAACLLLRGAGLEARLLDRVRAESEHAEILRTSRGRMLAASDTAREQLSQQVRAEVCDLLTAVPARMTMLHRGIGGPDTALLEVTDQVEAMIAGFRRMVCGVYLSVLADHGLAAALGSLLETVERPTTLKVVGLPRFPARVEACVYFCLATLLRDWPGGEARVLISVSAQDGRIGVVLFDPEESDFSNIATAAGWELVANWISAIGGTLASSPNFGGLIITIDVPTREPE